MRYLVTNQKELFDSEQYVVISVEESLNMLEPLKLVGLDTETRGFDPYTKDLLSVQLGTYEFQIIIDCSTIDILLYKDYFENPERIFILVNAKFDLKFFYHKRIIIANVWDTFLAEKLIYLGYPPGMHGLGLADCARKYLGVDLDKSVRGNIIWEGLTERVIVYAGDDVKYLIPLREKQIEVLKEKDLITALSLENEFVKVLAYIEYCGVKLDVKKWREKMSSDQDKLDKALSSLNDWVVEWALNPNVEDQKGSVLNRIPRDQLIKQRSRYIFHDMQGDLFTGYSGPKCAINWNSGKQVIPLFEELGFNLNTWDKEAGKMKKSIDANIIEPQKDISSIAPIYLEYKAAMKTTSTYGQNFIDSINPVSGRIHTQFNQLMDTGRLSCGGKNKDAKIQYLNLQNLPSDKETRACFVSEKGNLWASADYSGQESVIITNVSRDPNLISFFNDALGDLHSYVAKLTFHEELKDIPLDQVKEKAKHYRQIAKKVEFAANYGGDGNTISQNVGVSKAEGEMIYDNYLKAFPGLKNYFDFCRYDVMQKGYILLNPVVKNKAHIYDYDKLMVAVKRFTPEFWAEYRVHKANRESLDSLTPSEKSYMWEEFTVNETPIEELAEAYQVSEYTVMATVVKHYFQRKAASEKQSINYRIQGTGACMFKLASIKFFNWLKEHNLLFTVKYCIPVHDEINIEFPEELKDTVPDILIKCMKSAGDTFCKIVKLDADIEISDHWIH